jgi:hypothetical protein
MNTLHKIASCRIVALALALSLCLLPDDARAQEMARLAPASTGVFIELHDMAKHRALMEADPLTPLIREHFPPREEPEAWVLVQEAMGMNGEELFDRYFGQKVAIVVQQPGDDQPGVILSQIAKADAQLVIDNLELQEDGRVGRFSVYQTADGEGLFAFGEGLMALAAGRHEAWMKQVLAEETQGKSLADDAAFKAWMARLPKMDDAAALGYVRGPADNESHAMVIRRTEHGGMRMHYAGMNQGWANLLKMRPEGAGPIAMAMPDSVMAMVAMNVQMPLEADAEQRLNGLMGPEGGFREKVWSKLRGPVVMFAGSKPGEELEPKVDAIVPTMGMAVGLSDLAAGADIDRMMANVVMLANVARPEGSSPLKIEQRQHGGVTYHVVNVGPMIAQARNRQEMAGMVEASYGVVGSSYVVTTQQSLMQQMIDAAAKAANQPAADKAGPNLGMMWIKPQPMSDMMASWTDTLKKKRPLLGRMMEEGKARRPAARMFRNIQIASQIMAHFQLASMELRSDEPNVVTGMMELQRQPAHQPPLQPQPQ